MGEIKGRATFLLRLAGSLARLSYAHMVTISSNELGMGSITASATTFF